MHAITHSAILATADEFADCTVKLLPKIIPQSELCSVIERISTVIHVWYVVKTHNIVIAELGTES